MHTTVPSQEKKYKSEQVPVYRHGAPAPDGRSRSAHELGGSICTRWCLMARLCRVPRTTKRVLLRKRPIARVAVLGTVTVRSTHIVTLRRRPIR